MHDEHFLERLDRLEDHEVPDALALYYDPPLVRQLLAHAPERGHGDRVAISLDDPRDGPFIVVTQGGAFVTTLGRGMSPTGLPVVPRSIWDKARREDARVDEAFALARAATNGKLRRLWDELTTRGPYVSREAMTAAVAVGRLLEADFVQMWANLNVTFGGFLTRMRTREGYRSLTDESRLSAARLAWTVGHFSVILGASDVKKHTEGAVVDAFRTLDLAAFTLRFGMLGPYIRSLWTAGKLGPLSFQAAKNTFRSATTRDELIGSALSLAAIGLRFRKYRGEVGKILTIGAQAQEDETVSNRRAVGELALRCLTRVPTREDARIALQAVGARLWVKHSQALPADHPLRVTSEDAVPADLAVPLYAAMSADLWALGVKTASATPMLACAALDAEELYFPRAVVEAMPPPDLLPWAYLCCARVREDVGRGRATSAAPPKPGRNEPCTCGSGQKYKRCCGQ
jgi:hypothetical protein